MNSFLDVATSITAGIPIIHDTNDKLAQIAPANANPQTRLLSVKIPPTIAIIPKEMKPQKTIHAITPVAACAANDCKSTTGAARSIKIPATFGFPVLFEVVSIRTSYPADVTFVLGSIISAIHSRKKGDLTLRQLKRVFPELTRKKSE